MNVTDLARQLRIHPQKLLQILPEFGFDIGARAVKIDDRVAEKIRREWRRIKFVMEDKEKLEKEKQKELEKEARRQSGVSIKIGNKITVKDLAVLLDLPLSKLIMELMKNGILATQNEFLDKETATIIAQDLGFKVEEGQEVQDDSKLEEHAKNLEKILETKTAPRSPVIVVMGHVDHGKTKLLDAVRRTNVVESEAGGITQHIGAYQTVWTNPKSKEKRKITFIDTPGHEAFTVMRSRGAKVADIAILVVAADDGVKPQTIEAINIIKAAKIPFLVAVNKIDKEGADPTRVRTELSQNGVISDEWGGDVPMVDISAKQDMNIDKLLDTLLLLADMHDDVIRAEPDRPAAGTVIEAHVDKGEGPVASLLVQTGTLKINDPLVVNGEIYGKVRAMKNYRGENLIEAGPSTPVRVLGFKVAPQVGDILDIASAGGAKNIDLKSKRTKQIGAEQHHSASSGEKSDEEKKYFNIIVKADTLGSLEAIIGSLEKLKNEEVAVKIVGKGLGNVSPDDVTLAETTNAIIFGFNVSPTSIANEMIMERGVDFKAYKIIYDLLDFVKDELEKLLNPVVLVTELGIFKVMAVFRTEKNFMILGGRVEKGKLEKLAKLRVKRAGEFIGVGSIGELQIGKQNVKEAPEGTECGLRFEGKLRVEEGDFLEAYREEKKEKKLILN